MKASRKKNLSLGSLDLLVLRILNQGAKHGYGIARDIELLSRDVLSVKKGSLYPALHRLESEGYIKSEWKTGEINKPMKTYALTPAGKKQMQAEIENWELTTRAINMVIAKT